MRRRPFSSVFCPLLFGCLAACAARMDAQTAVPDANGRLVFKANARIVVLDVVVTGKEGKPVEGLRREDFSIAENGKPQQISSFEEHKTGPTAPAQLPDLPPNVFTNFPRVKPTDSVNVLLFDSLNTPIESQSFVRGEMMKYLKTPQSGRRIAIFTLGTQLRYVEGFTDDPEVLAAALNNSQNGSSPRQSPLLQTTGENDANQKSLGVLYQNFSANPSLVNLQSMQSVQQFQAEQATFKTDERVNLTLEAMQQLARYLAGIPGRKNVIWFSGAFPPTLFPNPDLADSFVTERKYDRQVQKTDALLSAAEVAIYPIAAGGNTTDALYDADQAYHGKINMIEAAEAATSHPGIPQAQSQGEQSLNMETDSLQKSSVQRNANNTTMEIIAHDTGGEAFFNNNGVEKAVSRVLDHGSRFYTITYSPTDITADGQYRKVVIKVDPKSGSAYQLAYRRGYFAADPKTVEVAAIKAGTDPLHPFMGPGMPASTQILFAMRVKPGPVPSSMDTSPEIVKHQTPVTNQFGQTQMVDHNELQPTYDDGSAHAGDNPKVKGKLTRYTVDFVIAARGLQLQEIPNGGRRDSIESTLVAYDRDGRPLNWMVRQIDLTLDAAKYAQAKENGVNFRLALDIPKDAVTLRSGIYDMGSGLTGTMELPLSNVNTGQAPGLKPR